MTEELHTGRRRTSRLLILVGALFVLVVGLAIGVWEYGRTSQWWGETPALKHLKASPLASTTLVGFERIHQEQSQPVGYLGKRSPDWYSGWYELGSVDASQVKREIVTFAEQNGFVNQNEDPRSTYLIRDGDEYGEVSLFVSIVDSSDTPKPPAELVGKVVVNLSYR